MKKKAYIKYNLLGEEKIEEKEVIINNGIISYIDNDIKISIDTSSGLIIRENIDLKYVIDLSKDYIKLSLKKEKLELEIKIKVLVKDYHDNYLYVKYLLVDENIINEYEIKI